MQNEGVQSTKLGDSKHSDGACPQFKKSAQQHETEATSPRRSIGIVLWLLEIYIHKLKYAPRPTRGAEEDRNEAAERKSEEHPCHGLEARG
jgi:hypothetical protein